MVLAKEPAIDSLATRRFCFNLDTMFFFNDLFLASKVVGALYLRNELVEQSVGSDSLPNIVIIDGLRTRSILSLPANERG